jgi:hypothetical protein
MLVLNVVDLQLTTLRYIPDGRTLQLYLCLIPHIIPATHPPQISAQPHTNSLHRGPSNVQAALLMTDPSYLVFEKLNNCVMGSGGRG